LIYSSVTLLTFDIGEMIKFYVYLVVIKSVLFFQNNVKPESKFV